MDSEEQKHLYGDPAKVTQYLDYSDQKGKPDNACYVPELVPGVLQPLEINEIMEDDPATDELLSKLEIEKIVEESEALTGSLPNSDKQMSQFPKPATKDSVIDMGKWRFSASTRKKAMWAGCIFEQWKCIWNFKIKCQGTNLDDMIDGNLLTLGIEELNKVLSLFIMEIHKQSGEEYPRETLYEIILSIQHYMAINGCELKLLDHAGLVGMHNTLDNHMKQLSKQGVVHERV